MGQCPELGVAVCGKLRSEPHSKADAEFVLAWDMPYVRFGAAKRKYKRYATKLLLSGCVCLECLKHYTTYSG